MPERYRKGYLDWLGEKRDWPIGRQLWWGHQIPVWQLILHTRDQSSPIADYLAHIEKRFRIALSEFAKACEIDGELYAVRSEVSKAMFFICRTEAQ